MHYGHPDVFDRLFHLTRGGISKSSKLIHVSEDIFAGFNTTLRQGNVTHHEYIQVGKGRDVGMNQIALFEAKVSSGNGEQTLSRDLYRLGQQFDFFRMMSFFFTSVGFHVCTLVTFKLKPLCQKSQPWICLPFNPADSLYSPASSANCFVHLRISVRQSLFGECDK